jgi:hypothetical protein
MTALLVGAVIRVHGQHSAEEIAGSIVIGQAYTSGNVYLGGFTGTEPREWPKRVTVNALRTPNALPLAADFTRALAPDSEELFSFPQREDGGSAGPDDLFSTIDSMSVTDANIAIYRSTARVAKPLPVFGWDEGLTMTDVSFRNNGARRPMTSTERLQIAEEKRASTPRDVECTTEPRFLDAATVILDARVGKTKTTIRLSTYATPGCAGHLSEVYVLDVLEPGQEPRRFEFRHYVGLL